MGLMFYIIIKKLPNSNENMAIVGSTLTVSIMFAAIHIGVYGLSIPTMLYLVVGRAIYNLVFLKTRTMLTSTVAHLGHNFLVSFMGI
jgi:membrane protease YdiL (CAAX protease family)